jgi:hypothetical protein
MRGMSRAGAAISVPPQPRPRLANGRKTGHSLPGASGVVAWATRLQAHGANKPYWLTGRTDVMGQLASHRKGIESVCINA